MVRRRTLLPLCAAVLVLAGCVEDGSDVTPNPDQSSAPESPPEPVAPEVSLPEAESAVLAEEDPASLAAAASRSFFSSAPLVVVAPGGDPGAQLRAASAAVALGMPMVLAPAAEDPEDAEDPENGGGAANSEGAQDDMSPAEDDASPAEDDASPAEGDASRTEGDPSTVDGDATGADSAASQVADVVADEVDRLSAQATLVFGDVVTDGLEVDVVTAPEDAGALAELLDLTVADVAFEPDQQVRAALQLEPGELGLLTPSGGEPDAESPAAEDVTDTGEEGTASDEQDAASGEDAGELPLTTPAEPLEDLLVMTTGEPAQLAAVANARAVEATVQVVPAGDPRASSSGVKAVAASEHTHVLGLGSAFGDGQTLQWRAETAATGTELPGGGQLVLPGKTYVALYGNPTTGALGVLGEQGPEATIERAREHAAPYEGLTDTTVVPALEIIATVASAGAGDDGNYSSERPIEELRPLVDLARENGQYVVLDLQPGRTDFVTQAQLYEELLREPHVGLALDPEWRLEPDEVHLRQIGQVDVAEVNDVVTWLADFTREHQLPQKMLILHQFQVRMIPGVDDVDLSRSELAVLIHVDGQGSQPAKQDTWRVLHNHAPDVQYWGWKNFYDEDIPMLTPEQTMQVEPVPNFISYQ